MLAQYYAANYVPLEIHVSVDFEDRATLEKALTEKNAAVGSGYSIRSADASGIW